MYLLFDIGATNTRLGLTFDKKKISHSVIYSTPYSFDEGICKIREHFNSFKVIQPLVGVAGGIAATLDKDKNVILRSPNLPDWINQPIETVLTRTFKTDVLLENDAALVGLSTAKSPICKQYDIVAYLTISTGVGGVRIVKGEIDSNNYGFQPGHQYISTQPDLKTLEDLVAGSSLAEKYKMPAKEIKDIKVWNEVAYNLAIGIHNTIVHWSPDIVVLGGAVMNSIDIDLVNTNLNRIMKIFPSIPPVIKSEMDQFAGLNGAIELIKQNQMIENSFTILKPYFNEK